MHPLTTRNLSLNSPTVPSFQDSRFPTPTPSPPLLSAARTSPLDLKIKGLLIPTDRTLEELEIWLAKLGRLRVEREIVLQGYSLYAVRSWYLSRTHWSLSIVTHTGKPTEHISTYLVVPNEDLSEKEGALEVETAVRYLANETRSHAKKIEYGTILVTTPQFYGQDISPIPGGDLRVGRPYMLVTTGLRRLGCGGRAAMGMQSPIPAVRRKFFELYHLPMIPYTPQPVSRATSPSASPDKPKSSPASPLDNHPIASDPLTGMIIELVKLIQGALAMWGLFGSDREELGMNGLFCDETKTGVQRWRMEMGMEEDESMKLEKTTFGGVVDPKTLAALLSSITSVRYELASLGVEKDPFTNVKRFLAAWQTYESEHAKHRSTYLSVSSIQSLNTHYQADRTRSPSDALKVHKLIFSQVAHATSSISLSLKGGLAEDGPMHRRIIAEGDVGPDVITTDLEGYTRFIIKSREKDWDVMGARHVAAMWNGTLSKESHQTRRHLRMLKLKPDMKEYHALAKEKEKEDEMDSGGGGGKRPTFKEMGHAIKGGFGLVSRRNTAYETSDSEGVAGPSSVMNHLMRKKQGTVPTVIEPELAEVDEALDRFSASPSTTSGGRNLDLPSIQSSSTARPAFLVPSSRAASKRPSIITDNGLQSVEDLLSDFGVPERPIRPRPVPMMRTASDGADVMVQEDGFEWQVVNPHGTGKGHHFGELGRSALIRRHSIQDRLAYKDVRALPVEHLEIDVEMCGIVWEMREKERMLADKARDVKILESSIFHATSYLIDAIRGRRLHLIELEKSGLALDAQLAKSLEEVYEDKNLQWASKKIQFYLSEETNLNEVVWNMRALEKDWEKVRSKIEERRREVEEEEERGRAWWRFGL